MKRFSDVSKIKFSDFIKERRTAINFDESINITEKDIADIIELVQYAPSSFNLQHVKYKVLIDRDKRELVKPLAMNQHKIITASAIILVYGNLETYKNVESIMKPSKDFMSEEHFQKWIEGTYNLYEGKGNQFMREEVIRNSSLSVMLFMLVAKDKGWDTGVIIGYDEEEISKFFNLSDKDIPSCILLIGKQPEIYKNYKRPIRKPIEDYLEFI